MYIVIQFQVYFLGGLVSKLEHVGEPALYLGFKVTVCSPDIPIRRDLADLVKAKLAS